jgi:hypothetical protein
MGWLGWLWRPREVTVFERKGVLERERHIAEILDLANVIREIGNAFADADLLKNRRERAATRRRLRAEFIAVLDGIKFSPQHKAELVEALENDPRRILAHWVANSNKPQTP